MVERPTGNSLARVRSIEGASRPHGKGERRKILDLELAIVALAVMLQTMLGWRWFLLLAGALWWLTGRSRWLAVGLAGFVLVN